jgi:predicted MFS family arabinose efflux permease
VLVDQLWIVTPCRLCLNPGLCLVRSQRLHPKSVTRFGHCDQFPFRLYFGGQVVSASGSFLQQTAIGWLVLERTGSPSDLGRVLAAGGIPSLILGPWGGAIADRVDLRKLLIATQALYCLLAALLWWLALEGHAGVTTLLIIGVAGGFVQIADSPARQAFVSRLVPSDDLASAVSLNGVVVNSARVVGPPSPVC